MSNEARESPEEKTVSCGVCRREVPRSEAQSVEAEDYVWYFCGLECFTQWRRRRDPRSDPGR